MPQRLNKRRAVALLNQAQLHVQRGEWARVVELAGPVSEAGLGLRAADGLLADGLRKLGRRDEAKRVLEVAHQRFPGEAEIEARLGSLLLELEEVDRAIELLGRARMKKKRDPALLTHYAAALLRAGRLEDAESQLAQALLLGGGFDSKLVLALVQVRRGRVEEADLLAGEVETRASDMPALQWSARSLRANIRLLLGDPQGAVERWRAIDAAGMTEPAQLAHMAYAEQLVGDASASDALMARRLAQGPSAEDLLLFAQIDNLRQQPARALERLEAAEAAPGERGPGWAFELAASRGRALRLAGQHDEAGRVLAQVSLEPAVATRLGAPVWVDLGHLAASSGDFERAVECYGRALLLVKDDPEATRGLELARRRVAWRESVQASAQERVDAAQAEAEAMRRRFLSREGELEALRRELEQLKRTTAQAVHQVQAERSQAEVEQRRVLRLELEARDRDVEEKAKENLARAFGCDIFEPVGSMLLVAERTFQKALYTELPAAAVAVLFSGALERSMIELLVRPFDTWLSVGSRRAAFLEGAVRERRGQRVEYFDRLVEGFDRALDSRAPALGEVSRVLERRREPYLAPFVAFLGETWALDEAFFDELGRFVQWSKEKLRDPVAHGRLELGWDELKVFREKLLFAFAGAPRGLLPALVGSRRG